MDLILDILKSGVFWTAVGSIAAVVGVLIAILQRGHGNTTRRLSRQDRLRMEVQAQEAAKKFDNWMKTYTHHGDKTDSERMVEWIDADKGYAKVGEQYHVFVRMAKHLKDLGYDTSPPPTEAEFIAAVGRQKSAKHG